MGALWATAVKSKRRRNFNTQVSATHQSQRSGAPGQRETTLPVTTPPASGKPQPQATQTGLSLLMGCSKDSTRLFLGAPARSPTRAPQHAENSHHSRQPWAGRSSLLTTPPAVPGQRHSVTHEGGTLRSCQDKQALGPHWTWAPGHTLNAGLSLPQKRCPPYSSVSPSRCPAITPEKALCVPLGLTRHKSWTIATFHLSRVGRVGEDRDWGRGDSGLLEGK